jgi:translation initiation factor IF-1
VSKNDFIELEGVVEEVRPNATFSVVTDQGHKLLAHLSGRMRQNRIQVLLGDKVKLEVSPYDVTKGRITYRSK